MNSLAHILVIDDDERLADLLSRYLSSNGFLVTIAHNTAEARQLMQVIGFDLLVLDVMMPNETGFEFIQSLRKLHQLESPQLSKETESPKSRESSRDSTTPMVQSQIQSPLAILSKQALVPILLLTARGEESDRISGLEYGADDYLPKPFNPREVALRIESILRRSKLAQSAAKITENSGTSLTGDRDTNSARQQLTVASGERRLNFGSLWYDLQRQSLHSDQGMVRLTTAEQSLMVRLTLHIGLPQSRDILRLVIEQGDGNIPDSIIAAMDFGQLDPNQTRMVDVHVNRLRQKLEPDQKLPRYLQTVWGKGYLLRPD